MVRSRIFKQSSTVVRPWAAGLVLAAAGPALAAPSPNESLNAAVTRELGVLQQEMGIRPAVIEDDAAPRRLPGSDDAGVRPVSDQQPQAAPTKPQPTASQLEVMKQLEELYKRDGREMPPMRLKEAPNTYLPKEQMPKKRTASSAAGSNRPTQVESQQNASSNNYSSLFSGNSANARKPSLLDRLRGRGTAKPASSNKSDGGLFSKLLSPLRKDSKPKMLPPQHMPAPAPLPEYNDPSNIAEQQFAPPHQLEHLPARPLEPRRMVDAAPSAPAVPTQTREANPFAEASDTIMVINPSRPHPFEDAFVEVRGEFAPDIATVAAVDPAFIDDNAYDMTADEFAAPDFAAPRALAPATVAESDVFAPVTPEIAPEQVTAEQATAARYAALQRKLAERTGLGGFQGFCPVALRDRRELIDARPEFLSIHAGRTYELGSAEAKARFEADPAKYAPMSQGNDVVLISRGETEAEGNLNYAVWYKDRLYLFRSAATLREFNASPITFAIVE